MVLIYNQYFPYYRGKFTAVGRDSLFNKNVKLMSKIKMYYLYLIHKIVVIFTTNT